MKLRAHRKKRLHWQGEWSRTPAICRRHTTIASAVAHGGGFPISAAWGRGGGFVNVAAHMAARLAGRRKHA